MAMAGANGAPIGSQRSAREGVPVRQAPSSRAAALLTSQALRKLQVSATARQRRSPPVRFR